MSITNKQFQWVDRDTAARDLLQLYPFNLPFLRDRVLKLLYAVRSPSVVPDLLRIAFDDDTDTSDGSRIMGIIATTPGNFYLPNFDYLCQKYNLLHRAWYPNLLKNHPVNKDQVLQLLLKQFSATDNVKRLRDQFKEWLDCLPATIAPLLMKLLDKNPKLFDLSIAFHLHIYTHELTHEWLQNRWDDLIYLSLMDGLRDKNLSSPNHHQFVRILEGWPELKTDLFGRCPAIIEEYAQKKHSYDQRFEPRFSIRASFDWQELEMKLGIALQGDEEGIKQFLWMNIYGDLNEDLCYKAGAIYLAGTLLRRYTFLVSHFESLVENDKESWRDPEDVEIYRIYYPQQYEAANALRNIVSPSTWETFIRAYLKHPFNELATWIGELTDQLSGVPIEASYKPFEHRPWFRSLYDSRGAKSRKNDKRDFSIDN